MNRRSLIRMTAAGMIAAPFTGPFTRLAAAADVPQLQPPTKGRIPVAVLLSKDAVVIDFAGPWEVFQDVRDLSRGDSRSEVAAFQLYTVAATLDPIVASGGMTIVPNYTFETAPQPKVIVIPAQNGAGDKELAWLRKASSTADMTMSVCTGAFVLARTGLLDGKSATTHHSSFDSFERLFPKVKLERGARFVDNGNIATSAGLSAGIDLALYVVARYFGKQTAEQTAKQMEYQSDGWAMAGLPESPRSEATPQDTSGYVCPPCGCAADGRVFQQPGRCPACGMGLIKKG